MSLFSVAKADFFSFLIKKEDLNMLQIKNLNITHKKDLKDIIKDFNLSLNYGDKTVIIGEEGNGKSSILKWLYSPNLIKDYAEFNGELISTNEKLAYLPQELSSIDKEKSVYEYFSEEPMFWEKSPKELSQLASIFSFKSDIFYSEQKLSLLSGGERVKVQMMKILITKPTVLLLDEPSNDIDTTTLEWLEKFINDWEYIVIFISHDETLIENTANMIVHIEQIKRKTESRYTIAKLNYNDYVSERLNSFKKLEQLAANEKREKEIRDEKLNRVMQSVEHAQNTVSRQDPSTGRLLKKKMHVIKSMEKRFLKEDETMTQRPDYEDAIGLKLSSNIRPIPSGKIILDYHIDCLKSADGLKELSRNIDLYIEGAEKICIVGDNGVGKTTLLKDIAKALINREDISAIYMPQNYSDELDMSLTPIDYLDTSGDKAERTRIQTFLGSMKYTANEMSHSISELSGGQKAKILLLKIVLSDANVLLLDEPTRNFSPLSNPVIRSMLKEFKGAIISVSHDRKYINEVCEKVYVLTSNGLKLKTD